MNEEVLQEVAEEKFTFKKVDGFYRIVDNDSGKYVGFNGKMFKAKTTVKLAGMLFKLRSAYVRQLQDEK